MVEHHLDMVVVGGSIPLAPTIFSITYVPLLDVEFICRRKSREQFPAFAFVERGIEESGRRVWIKALPAKRLHRSLAVT